MGGARVERIQYIDGLRAVAVLAVVGCHTVPGWYFGAHGVELFFVISGFCLAYPSLHKLRAGSQATFDVSRFGAHRLSRIVPPYYAAIALLLCVTAVVHGLHLRMPNGLNDASLTAILRQALFLDGYGTHLINGAFWTLAVEFRWYLLFPIALLLWVRSPRAFALLAVCAAASSVTRFTAIDIVVLPAFLLGIVAAHIRVHGSSFARYALPLSVALLTAACLTEPRPGPGQNYISPLWYGGLFALVVAAGEIPMLTRVLQSRVPAFIGVASYSIYLIHGPVIGLVANAGLPPAVGAGAGVFAGIGFWFCVERPLLRPHVRARMISELTGPLTRWLKRFGIPKSFTLSAPRTVSDVMPAAALHDAYVPLSAPT